MKIDSKKLASAAGDWRTIILTGCLVFSGIGWGADTYFDTKYMTIAAGQTIPLQVKIDRLSEEIEIFVLEKRFENDPAKIRKLNAMIEYKEKKRAAEVQKYELMK